MSERRADIFVVTLLVDFFIGEPW